VLACTFKMIHDRVSAAGDESCFCRKPRDSVQISHLGTADQRCSPHDFLHKWRCAQPRAAIFVKASGARRLLRSPLGDTRRRAQLIVEILPATLSTYRGLLPPPLRVLGLLSKCLLRRFNGQRLSSFSGWTWPGTHRSQCALSRRRSCNVRNVTAPWAAVR
jgi:hypothetical protein